MALTQAIATSWKAEVVEGLHNFTLTTGNVFKVALYTSSATMDATTTVYSVTNEITGTNYVAGGATLTNITPLTSGTTAYFSFQNAVWSSASFTARGALIYNSTNGNRAVAVLDFGADKTVTAGTFTIVWPTNDASNAIIRIA